MKVSSIFKRSQKTRCDNLVPILPNDPAGVPAVHFGHWMPQIAQKPGQVPCLGNEGFGRRAKPANTADLGLAIGAIAHPQRCVQVFVKPIKHAAHLLDLPMVTLLWLLIPDIKGGTENALVAPGTSVADTRFKSDIHGDFLRDAQTFLGNSMKKFVNAERQFGFGTKFSQWILQRKTFQSRLWVLEYLSIISNCRLGKPPHWQPNVQGMETIS